MSALPAFLNDRVKYQQEIAGGLYSGTLYW